MQLHKLPSANLRNQFLRDWREAIADLRSSLRGRRGRHVLVAMRERPCAPVPSSVVLEPPVGFMVSISPRLPGMPSPSRPARGVTCCKTAAEAPGVVKLIPRGEITPQLPDRPAVFICI